jgi:hypothetical protein
MLVPPPGTDPLALADWLELKVLLAADKNASAGDLERVLHRAGHYESREDNEAKVNEVFEEIEDRSVAGGAGYPFSVKEGLLQLRSKWETHPAYAFCLGLSRLAESGAPMTAARRLFEKLATRALASYLGGHAVRFGAPRDDLPKSFGRAIEQLCNRLGEGRWSRHPASTGKPQDGGLDVVAWKGFPDGRVGQVIVFAQCASGKDWKSKVHDLQPESFSKTWMPQLYSSPLRAFFVPHRLERQEWNKNTADGGILFDRCRLAHCLPDERSFPESRECSKWLAQTLSRIAETLKARRAKYVQLSDY